MKTLVLFYFFPIFFQRRLKIILKFLVVIHGVEKDGWAVYS